LPEAGGRGGFSVAEREVKLYRFFVQDAISGVASGRHWSTTTVSRACSRWLRAPTLRSARAFAGFGDREVSNKPSARRQVSWRGAPRARHLHDPAWLELPLSLLGLLPSTRRFLRSWSLEPQLPLSRWQVPSSDARGRTRSEVSPFREAPLPGVRDESLTSPGHPASSASG
jgi:hypothetical protein